MRPFLSSIYGRRVGRRGGVQSMSKGVKYSWGSTVAIGSMSNFVGLPSVDAGPVSSELDNGLAGILGGKG